MITFCRSSGVYRGYPDRSARLIVGDGKGEPQFKADDNCGRRGWDMARNECKPRPWKSKAYGIFVKPLRPDGMSPAGAASIGYPPLRPGVRTLASQRRKVLSETNTNFAIAAFGRAGLANLDSEISGVSA